MGSSDGRLAPITATEYPLHYAPGRGFVHSGHNSFHVAAQSGQLLIAQDHKRDLPGLQVLLTGYVFSVVSRISKPSASASAISSPFNQSVPSAVDCFNNSVSLQGV